MAAEERQGDMNVAFQENLQAEELQPLQELLFLEGKA
jgi:hypothetical protein